MLQSSHDVFVVQIPPLEVHVLIEDFLHRVLPLPYGDVYALIDAETRTSLRDVQSASLPSENSSLHVMRKGVRKFSWVGADLVSFFEVGGLFVLMVWADVWSSRPELELELELEVEL